MHAYMVSGMQPLWLVEEATLVEQQCPTFPSQPKFGPRSYSPICGKDGKANPVEAQLRPENLGIRETRQDSTWIILGLQIANACQHSHKDNVEMPCPRECRLLQLRKARILMKFKPMQRSLTMDDSRTPLFLGS